MRCYWNHCPLRSQIDSSPWLPSRIALFLSQRCRTISRVRPRSAVSLHIVSGRQLRRQPMLWRLVGFLSCRRASSRRWELVSRQEQPGRSRGMNRIALRWRLSPAETTEHRILGLEDDTHAPAAQLLDDAVVRDGLADHWRESYVCETGKSMKAVELVELAVSQK